MDKLSLSFMILIAVILMGIYGIYLFMKNLPPPNSYSLDGKSGVSGWLGFLVICLLFIVPLMGIGGTNDFMYTSELNSPELLKNIDWQLYKSNAWGLTIIITFLSIYAGYGLAKGRNETVVHRAIILLWVTGPIARIVLNLLLPKIRLGIYLAPLAVIISQIVASALLITVWTFYLKKSNRVKSTYFVTQPNQKQQDSTFENDDSLHEPQDHHKNKLENLKQKQEEFNKNVISFRKEQEQFRLEQAIAKDREKYKRPTALKLNPKIFIDACEIVGSEPTDTIDSIKQAYRHLRSIYHPDKIERLGGRRKAQAEGEIKLINQAWGTIQKHLKIN